MSRVNCLFAFLFFLTFGCSPSLKKSAEKETVVEFETVVRLAGKASSNEFLPSSHSFSHPIPNLSEEELTLHLDGDALFEMQFSDDPQRPEYGLGPVYNNSSCIACHNRDGRGSLPLGLSFDNWQKIGNNEALFLRISIENDDILNRQPSDENKYNAPEPVPGFGTQIFHLGSLNLRNDSSSLGQAEVWVKLEKSHFTYPDGEVVELVKPVFKIENPYDQSLEKEKNYSRLWQEDVRISPRLGMPMFGLGLLEAIKDEDIINQAKKDFSQEGVFGKVNLVFDIEKHKQGIYPAQSIGRFGLKANTPTVLHQSLAALNGDIGVTSEYFPNESILSTKLYKNWSEKNQTKKEPQVDNKFTEALVFYSKTLAVPNRRNFQSKNVVNGARLFDKVRCTSCHRPSFVTGNSDIKSLAFQKIYPFTDMLLHDMGEGLADKRQDFLAKGREWRTRPLWGIGLSKIVNPRATFLHDGRARTLEEAILWHDGEARFSRDQFSKLKKQQRQSVIEFLRSL